MARGRGVWGGGGRGDPQAAAPFDLRLNDLLSPDAYRDLRTHTRITRAQPRRTKSGPRASKLVPGKWSEWWWVVGWMAVGGDGGWDLQIRHPLLLGRVYARYGLWRRVKIRMWSSCFLTHTPQMPVQMSSLAHCPTPHHPPGQADDWGAPSIRRSEWAPSILVPTCHMQQSWLPAGCRVWTQPAWEGGGGRFD